MKVEAKAWKRRSGPKPNGNWTFTWELCGNNLWIGGPRWNATFGSLPMKAHLWRHFWGKLQGGGVGGSRERDEHGISEMKTASHV